MRPPLVTLVVVLLSAVTVAAQEPCPADRVSFFYAADPCVEAAASPPAAMVPSPPAPQAFPLFTPQTVAPHTPPLMLEFLQEPTFANALRYEAWDRQRQAHLRAAAYWLGLLRRPQK